MILEVAILNLKPGMSAEFEAAFTQAAPLIASIPGYLGHNVRRCIEASDKYILLVGWETLEAHTIGFRGSPQYQEWRALLHHFYDPFPTVEHYELPDGSAFGALVPLPIEQLPSIVRIEPACVILGHAVVHRRMLIIRGNNLDYPDLDLQFMNAKTNQKSIHFQNEIEWISPTEIRLDFDRIHSRLWQKRRLHLRVRFTDGSHKFKPLCEWSSPFVVAASEEECDENYGKLILLPQIEESSMRARFFDFVEEVQKRRWGADILFRIERHQRGLPLDASDWLDAFVENLLGSSYRAHRAHWKPITSLQAVESLSSLLESTIVHHEPLINPDAAARLAAEFVDFFSPDAQFFNSANGVLPRTIDGGVAVIDEQRIGILWFGEED